MTFKTVLVCIAALLVCSGFAFAQSPPAAPTPVPAAAFAVLPDQIPQLSPDGNRYAVMREQGGRPAIVVYRVDAAEPPSVVKSSSVIIDGFMWAKNDILLVYTSVIKTKKVPDAADKLFPFSRVTAIDTTNFKQRLVSEKMRISDIDLDDPDFVYGEIGNSLVRMNVRDGGNPESAQNGLSGKIGLVTNWFLDGHGKAVARTEFKFRRGDPKPKIALKVPDDEGNWREVRSFSMYKEADGLIGLSEDGRAVLRLTAEDSPQWTMNRVELADGSETPLFSDPQYDIDELLVDQWTRRIIGVSVIRDMPTYHYFDPTRQAVQKGLEAAFPGLSVNAVSTDLSRNRMLVATAGPRTPPTYYLLDRTTHEAKPVVASYPALTEDMLGEVKPYPYQARDGLAIPAYLILPPGREAKNLPLIVMPHGGPDARADATFDWWAQFLANRGYAVLKPNFRGSSGYGRKFTQAGLKQWGLKVQDDVSDGVAKMIADGIADPKRVCIVGASFGGYVALAGATLTPQLYACAVSYAGVSDLRRALPSNRYTAAYRFWVSRIGDPEEDSKRIDATSPAKHADRATAPILLLHSELDLTVPIEQSEIMEKALKDAGKAVEFVRLPGDDHHLTLSATRLRLLAEIERFLERSIGK